MRSEKRKVLKVILVVKTIKSWLFTWKIKIMQTSLAAFCNFWHNAFDIQKQ